MIDFEWRLYKKNRKWGKRRGKKNSKRSLDAGCGRSPRSPTHTRTSLIPPVSNFISLRLHDADETTWLRRELGKFVWKWFKQCAVLHAAIAHRFCRRRQEFKTLVCPFYFYTLSSIDERGWGSVIAFQVSPRSLPHTLQTPPPFTSFSLSLL